MLPHDIIKNLSQKTINDFVGFLKRDFLEIRFIQDVEKIKNFFIRSVRKNEERIINSLLLFNKTYGVLIDDEVVLATKGDLYWRICIVDDYSNFANNIPFWGIYLALVEKKAETEVVLNFSFCLPFLDEFFYCADGKGCLLNDRKLHLESAFKNLISSGSSRYTHRIFGSDVLTLMYVACNKVHFAVLQNNPFIFGLSKLVMSEVRGRIGTKDQKILIGNQAAVI